MHSRNSQSSESLASWQMIPGTSYGMTGKKEKEHLELPGKAFNLAVVLQAQSCFTVLGALVPFFLLLLAPNFLPYCGVWLLSSYEVYFC